MIGSFFNYELKIRWNESDVLQSEVLTWQLPGITEKNHDKAQGSFYPG
jgi:hypothetical protein